MGQPLLTESKDLKKPVLLALLIEFYFFEMSFNLRGFGSVQ